MSSDIFEKIDFLSEKLLKYENIIQLQNQFLNELFDASIDAIVVSDKDGTILKCNKTFKEIMGNDKHNIKECNLDNNIAIEEYPYKKHELFEFLYCAILDQDSNQFYVKKYKIDREKIKGEI